MTTKSWSFSAAAVAAALGIALFSAAAHAVPVSYTIDPSQSFLTVSGSVASIPTTPQSAGSDTASYSGTVVGDLTAGVLTFSGGSNVVAFALPAGTYSPPPVVRTNDNYGVVILGSVPTAIGNLVIDFSAGTITDGSAPVGMDTTVLSGELETGGLGNGSLAGTTNDNISLAAASITTVGNIETIVIPIRTEDTDEGPPASVTIFDGQIVAMRQIPEPSTLAIAGAGIIGLALIRRRKSRS